MEQQPQAILTAIEGLQVLISDLRQEIERRLDGIEGRLARVETRLSAVEHQLVTQAETLRRHTETLDEHTNLLREHGRLLDEQSLTLARHEHHLTQLISMVTTTNTMYAGLRSDMVDVRGTQAQHHRMLETLAVHALEHDSELLRLRRARSV
ncbi:hypothetical protein [Alicyclobacillus acidocaldarius]|uniref:Uncharacterized protein n=1 Tax=Alicyclobacillus acidocaldarius (strain Tc-4-1) TaxID=1048834 RepID=F8IDW5_ALIAT|nr:hypothetical protein [Alicyclobacillus acidocaldarius]AEJ42619.1 hypothetical protein TC41_0660 [Alicyclobacillus acidocaldarius subsp. acidocaldarius Tc-4-1]